MPGASPFASGEALWRAVGRWELLDEARRDPPSAGLARDAELLDAVRRGDAPATARIWDNGQALVVSRSDARLPGFAGARERLSAEGWPVLVRESGGGVVPHARGILHLSLVFRPPRGTRCTLEAVYGALALPLRDALARLGVDAELGDAPGSFCDGRFNLLVAGCKLAGTAQRWRGRPSATPDGRGAVLAHALLLVDGDVEAWTARVNRFYELAGGTPRARADASRTLASLVGARAAEARAELRAAVSRLAALGPSGKPGLHCAGGAGAEEAEP